REDRLRDQQRLVLGELSLVLVGVQPVQELAGDEPEHGIAEELETLVGSARPLAGHAQVGAVRQRQPEQLGVAELDLEVTLKVLEGAAFLLRAARADRPRNLAAEQPLDPAEQSGRRRRRRSGSSDASTAAAAAPARPAPQLAAFITSVTLWPPNPNEFEIAAFTGV